MKVETGGHDEISEAIFFLDQESGIKDGTLFVELEILNETRGFLFNKDSISYLYSRFFLTLSADEITLKITSS